MKPLWSGLMTLESGVQQPVATVVHTFAPPCAHHVRCFTFFIPARLAPSTHCSLCESAYRSGSSNSATVHSTARLTYIAADYTTLPSAWGSSNNAARSNRSLSPSRLQFCKIRKRNTTQFLMYRYLIYKNLTNV
jgi:hypothetical protein